MGKKKYIPSEKHHRRAQSLGGTDEPGNISLVLPSKHRHWHTLFGNMNAMQICESINKYCKPKNVTVICDFINGDPVQKTGRHEMRGVEKRQALWAELFKGMTFKQAVDDINSRWLDASYHLRIIRNR